MIRGTLRLGLTMLLSSGITLAACSGGEEGSPSACEGAACGGSDAAVDALACAPDQQRCGDICTDTRSSAAHCGGCGKACTADETCLAGACVCPIGAIACDGQCTDPRRNGRHCGATDGCGTDGVGEPGIVCAPNQFCSGGACSPCATFVASASPSSSGRVPVSPGPTALAASDLNGDGKVDLVVSSGATLDVFRGAGDGTFEALQRIPYGTLASSFVIADMDGDGRKDIVLASELNGPKIVVVYGYGDGTFDPSVQILPLAQPPSAPAVADFDGDGKLDIALPARFLKGYGIVLNRGRRTFAPPKDIATNGISPVALATGDFDGDGKADVALATDPTVFFLEDPGTVEVLLGRGDGAFGPKKTYAAGTRGLDLEAVDVDGDEKTDLVTADTGGTVLVYLGVGDGTFAPPKRLVSFPSTVQVVPTDVSGDGVVDLVVRTFPGYPATATTHFLVRIGAGDGSFFPAQVYLGGNAGVAVADVDGDGRADILAANAGFNDVTIYLGTTRPECK